MCVAVSWKRRWINNKAVTYRVVPTGRERKGTGVFRLQLDAADEMEVTFAGDCYDFPHLHAVRLYNAAYHFAFAYFNTGPRGSLPAVQQ